MLTDETTRDMFTGGRAGEYEVPDDGRPLDECKSCGARIIWTKTPAGKFTPLDLATVETRDGVKYALTHFATCPESRQWRKKP